jgi:ABC-type Na+ efflux pump permease subunit
MSIGPIFVRELTAVARQPATYVRRASAMTLLLLVIASNFAWFLYDPRLAGWGLSGVAWMSFISLASLHFIFSFGFVPMAAASKIAGERERDTLSSLLTTRLTSAEIIGSKLASSLVTFGAVMAACLPLMVLMVQFGGIDSRLVLLTYAGTASTAFFLMGLGLVVSTGFRLKRLAAFSTVLLMVLWLELPVIVIVILPRLIGTLPRWVLTISHWLLASSPTGLSFHLVGAIPRPSLMDAVAWMVGLETAGGLLLVGWAIARLRPASRRLEDKGSRAGTEGFVRGRPRRRPPCGEDAVFWKERYTSRATLTAYVLGMILGIALCAFLGMIVYYLAVPAANEVLAYGYGSGGQDIARVEFNRTAIRPLTSIGMFIYMLMLVAGIAESMEVERARDTWTVLISTPLSGREILGAKMAGAMHRFRSLATLLVVLWTIGLAVGSIHPLGFVTALAVLLFSRQAGAALGAYAAMHALEKTPRSGLGVTLLLLTIVASPLPCLFLQSSAAVPLGALSPPFVATVSLATYGEFREAFFGSGSFDLFKAYGRATAWDAGWIEATCVLGLVVLAGGAAWFKRAAFDGFDAAVGRPRRPSRAQEPRRLECSDALDPGLAPLG